MAESAEDQADRLRAARDRAKKLTWAASVLLPGRKELPWAVPIQVGRPTPTAAHAPLILAEALDSMRADPAQIHLVCAIADHGTLTVAAAFGNGELERMGLPSVAVPADADPEHLAEALRAIVLALKDADWSLRRWAGS